MKLVKVIFAVEIKIASSLKPLFCTKYDTTSKSINVQETSPVTTSCDWSAMKIDFEFEDTRYWLQSLVRKGEVLRPFQVASKVFVLWRHIFD